MDAATPVIDMLPSGGFRVSLNGVSGEGATLPEALSNLSAAQSSLLHSEKGDDTLATETATRQTDILANDRFLQGNQLQHIILLGVALGL